jgi:hypothetical protein
MLARTQKQAVAGTITARLLQTFELCHTVTLVFQGKGRGQKQMPDAGHLQRQQCLVKQGKEGHEE